MYYQVKHMPVLWIHAWRPIFFTLEVDNFVIGYERHENTYHIMSALIIYDEKITTYWERNLYCGIIMKWDYAKVM